MITRRRMPSIGRHGQNELRPGPLRTPARRQCPPYQLGDLRRAQSRTGPAKPIVGTRSVEFDDEHVARPLAELDADGQRHLRLAERPTWDRVIGDDSSLLLEQLGCSGT
jgi:hypothetical protein